jgi:hypothetical protein
MLKRAGTPQGAVREFAVPTANFAKPDQTQRSYAARISSAKPITQNHESFASKEIYDYAKASSQSSTRKADSGHHSLGH